MRTFFAGLNDSFTLLAFRISNASFVAKIFGLLFLIGAGASIYAALHVTDFIRLIMTAQLPDNPTAETAKQLQQFLSVYLGLYATHNMTGFISAAVALLLGSIIFVPFSGYVIHGMVSHSEMIIVKNGDSYKIGDSVLFQIISSFTLVQLVGLTVAAQLITFDSPFSSYTVIFVWGIWLTMTIFTAFFSWVVEYVSRRFGPRMRLLFLALFVIAIGVFLLLDPNHGTTLFGAANVINDFLTQLASGDIKLLIASLVILAAITVVGIYGITLMASHTLQIAEPMTISKVNSNGKQIKGTSNPLSPFMMFAQLLFRYKTVTKPVATAVVFSIIIVLLLKGPNALTTTMIVMPLAVGVSFGANIFGLISGSTNWLFSIAGWKSKMFTAATTVIFFSIISIYVAVYSIGLIVGSIHVDEVLKVIPAIISITFTTTAMSMFLSLRKPLPFSGKSRENLISSPTTLIGYVFILLLTAGTAGNLALLAPGASAWIIAGTTVLVTSSCWFLLYRTWMNTEKYSKRLLKETINAG